MKFGYTGDGLVKFAKQQQNECLAREEKKEADIIAREEKKEADRIAREDRAKEREERNRSKERELQ